MRCLGAMYEALGRLVGRSYEESFHHMAKWLKNAEVKLVNNCITETERQLGEVCVANWVGLHTIGSEGFDHGG